VIGVGRPESELVCDNPAMSALPRPFCHSFAILAILTAGVSAQPPQFGDRNDPAIEMVRQGQQKLRDGKPDEALALYREAEEKHPTSVAANNAAGSLLDLMGRYSEAQKHFAKAIEVASTPQSKAQAQRAMGMSYGFEGNCKNAVKYHSQVYQFNLDAKDFYQAGEMANEVARVCIDSGDLAEAQKWYKIGHDAGIQEPNISAARKDLWEFREEHAEARIAIRRGNKAEAQKHVAAAKAVLDKGNIPEQAQFYPYLTGYVSFYSGDYKTALADFQKAQNDPFIQVYIAQTYEKLGDQAQAMEYYRKAAGSNAHNPPNAFAHPFAKKKLGT
jgi:tetratricopeptide (TPR) repeat protein